MKKAWQIALTKAITQPAELLEIVNLDVDDLPKAYQAHLDFPIKVPYSWLSKIEKANPHDPLLLQVLPAAQELVENLSYHVDPLAERQSNPVPGLLHKYRSRALLITAGSCAINCRYCFRRHFPYDANQTGQKQWHEVVKYISRHDEINEVILSGGDPLMLPDRQLRLLTEKLARIAHLKILRIHSRLPVFIPERINADFAAWFISERFTSILVTHINHPHEIDARFIKKMQWLKKRGVILYNQSVLLKGVNDSPLILKQLSERLFFEAGIQPYYLNLLDKVRGAAHFDLPKQQALVIYHELQSLLPGYLVPKLVQENPQKPYKTIIS